MKILRLAHRDPLNPKAGGAELIIKEVGLRLAIEHYDLAILTGGWEGAKKKKFIAGLKSSVSGTCIPPFYSPHRIAQA